MGVTFSGIKVGQANWLDPDYAKNWANAKPYVYRMPYHFLTWDVNPKRQAETFWAALEKDTWGLLPLMCDFEWWRTIPAKAFDILYNFLERMKQLTNMPLGIYTAKSFWTAYGSTDAYWKQYALWQCWINAGQPPAMQPWDAWSFWQYTFKLDGPAYGAESLDLDGDWYNGTLEEMIARYKLPDIGLSIPAPVEPKPEPAAPIYVRVTARAGVKTRQGPGVQYDVTGSLVTGTVLAVAEFEVNEGWVRMADGNWAAYAYNGQQLMERVE